MKNYDKLTAPRGARTELHGALNLTGAEISLNSLPAGTSVPFVHSHRLNEEIYAITEGRGTAVIDGERVELKKGDWLRLSPAAERRFFAAAERALDYVCIQVKAGSLEAFTASDAVIK